MGHVTSKPIQRKKGSKEQSGKLTSLQSCSVFLHIIVFTILQTLQIIIRIQLIKNKKKKKKRGKEKYGKLEEQML